MLNPVFTFMFSQSYLSGSIDKLLEEITKEVPVEKLAIHCHNTKGQALPNILIALLYGISVVDASVAGLGGCPFVEGASGNVATEDVVYMLHGLNIETGIDLPKLFKARDYIYQKLLKTQARR